jgi:hypothetical protein
MKTSDSKKKVWSKPDVQVLDIKKDTFSGTAAGPEGAGYDGPPLPPS